MRTYLGQTRCREEARARSRRRKADGGLLHRFGEVKQSTENTKRRKNKFGDFARARRRSAKGSQEQRRGVAAFRAWRSSRRCFGTRLGRQLALGLEIGRHRGRVCYIKSSQRAEHAEHGDHALPTRSRGRVQCGHEVGEGSNQWAPPVCDTKRGTRLPVEEEREGVLAWGVTGPRLPLGPERRRKGGKVLGLPAENREGEFFSFF